MAQISCFTPSSLTPSYAPVSIFTTEENDMIRILLRNLVNRWLDYWHRPETLHVSIRKINREYRVIDTND
mgnify:CR=1 FL=1